MSTGGRMPQWKVERLALGELPADELQRAREELLAEPGGAERLAALQRENAALLEALPPEQVAGEVRRRAHLRRVQEDASGGRAESKAKVRWMMALGAPLVAALALLVVTAQPAVDAELGTPGPALVETTRLKGQKASLVLSRREGGRSHALSSGARVSAGDELQVGYVRAGRSHGVILSIDGRGAVTLHLPDPYDGAADTSAVLEGSGAVPLPHAYALDDAPSFERFFFVTSDRPFAVKDVVAAAERLAASPQKKAMREPLPLSLEQSSFLLLKEAQP